MSRRYLAGFVQDGLFNPLVAPTPTYLYNLFSWGNNSQGQLGLGNITNYSSPKQVGSLTTWSKIAMGIHSILPYSVATKTDGTLWSWGNNIYGQLGLGNQTSYSSPKQVGALTNWYNVAVGGVTGCTLAVKSNGTLWAWGASDTYGQLGLSNLARYSSPKQVGALSTWLIVSIGDYHTIATKTDGTLWAWGRGSPGQLGLGVLTDYSSPKQVGSLTTWSKISAGNSFTIATKTDGTLWSWGRNSQGQLGLGTSGNYASYSSPKQVGLLTTWLNITAGRYYTLATKTDGTLWSWGYNAQGQLGLGNITNYSSPNQIGSLTTWSNITAGSYHTIATKTDGTLWSWGSNGSGQLGLGNIIGKSSPNQIGTLTTWLNISAGYTSTIALG